MLSTLALSLILPWTSMAGPSSRPAGSQPNFVLVVADDLDIRLGSLDYLPTVQQMMVDGSSFTSFVTPTSLCCPGRTTILRGQYVHNHGVFTNFPPSGGFERFQELGLESATLASTLEGAGYRTALFGKYLNGYEGDPDDFYVPLGWTEWFGVVAGNGYSNYGYTLNEGGTLVAYGSDEEDYLTDVLAGHAHDVVLRSLSLGQPFFLYFSPYVPHGPAIPAPRHEALFPGVIAPRTPSFNEADVSDKPALIAALPPLAPDEVDQIDAQYRRRLRSLQAVDEALAGLVTLLAAHGQLDSTYFLFTTDNGFHMGQHRMPATKYFAYEEDVLGPLVVRGPGVAAGREVAQPANAADLAPTLLELAGVVPGWSVDGRSLVALWGPAPPSSWRATQLLEQFPVDGSDDPPALLARPQLFPGAQSPRGEVAPEPFYLGLRTDELKYVEWSTGEREVYFLRSDPYELDNRAACASPAFLAEAAAWTAALHACAGASCRALELRTPLLSDGFECGGTQAWSAIQF